MWANTNDPATKPKPALLMVYKPLNNNICQIWRDSDAEVIRLGRFDLSLNGEINL